MSERQNPPENRDAVAAAELLMQCMKAGDRIDPETFNQLVETLKAYQEGRFVQSVSAVAHVRAGVGPPPVPRAPIESPRLRTEAFLEREPWNLFRSQVARKEFMLLSEEERSFVVRAAEVLKEETMAHRILSAKAIGAKVGRYSHDYGGRDILLPSDRAFSWEKWGEYLNQTLSSQEKSLIGARPLDKNVIFATREHGFRERDLTFLSLHFWAPQNSTPVDNRMVSHEAVMFLKNGRFLQMLKTGRTLRLLPFIVKIAAIQINPGEAVFFDGSFAGGREPFGEAPNPIVTIIQDGNESCGFLDADTRTSHPAQPFFAGKNGREFLAAALSARGNAEQANVIDLHLSSGGIPRNLPRL